MFSATRLPAIPRTAWSRMWRPTAYRFKVYHAIQVEENESLFPVTLAMR
jgi:hypothetical protein